MKKKITAALFIIGITMCVLLSGCGQKEENTDTPSAMPNPMEEVTDETMIEELSYGIKLPNGAQNIETYLISGELFERRFEMDGISYTFRTQKADAYEDISGMYYEWDVTDPVELGTFRSGDAMRAITEEETVDVVNWYDTSVNANFSLSAVAPDLDGYDILAIVYQMLEATPSVDDYTETIPGVPPTGVLESSFFSFINWAGFQYFYDGIQFETLDDNVAVAMAAFNAQLYASQPVYSEDGLFQIISAEELDAAMMNLFGTKFDSTKVTSECQEDSNIVINSDGSVNIKLGDWGLVVPQMEITSIDKPNDQGEFTVNVRYYAYDFEMEAESENIPSYDCTMICKPDDNSIYGFVIKDMKAKIID